MHKAFSALLALWLACFPCALQALSLIRDAEIEDTLRAYGDPIFKVAGLNPRAIHIFIVEDPTVNAYVAGGANMFIHTGMILKADRPEMLIGVMAHETGHMAGGHLAQGTEQLKGAQLGSVVSMLLGIAMAVGGGGGAGIATMSAGQEVAMRNYLHFSRGNESAADQAGMDYLDALGISASGMLRMLEILRQDENRSFGVPDPYTRTHPLNIDRITHVRNHVMQSTIPENALPKGFPERHARMLAKLAGFTEPFDQVMTQYPLEDQTVPARYARAIAYYRNADLPQAFQELDALLAASPRDPFFHELKGQILFENGRIPQAAQEYGEAASLLPDSGLILSDEGKVLIARDQPGDLGRAVGILRKSTLLDDSNPESWYQLSIAYGKLGQMGRFHLASAEEASLEDNPRSVVQHANQALKLLGDDLPARLRANDLKLVAQKELKDQGKDTGEPKEKRKR